MNIKPILIAAFALSTCQNIYAQNILKNLYNQGKQKFDNATKGNGLSNDDIIKGLKEALTVGTQNSTNLASQLDGYFGNPNIKIPFPEGARKVESTLRQLGMNKQVDKVILTLNRAAEDAAKQAAPVFIAAISKMNINDGLSILKGSNDAATQFLKRSTSNELLSKFKPIVQQSLQKVAITRYWNPLINKYNRIPFVEKQNPNLDDYVTQKALDGLFLLVTQEEAKIRKDPAARVSDILKKVFGG